MKGASVGKSASLVLFAVAAGLLAWSATIWFQDGKKIGSLRARQSENEAVLKTTRIALNDLGLRYRALQTSYQAVTDSMRQATKVERMTTEKNYERDIFRLERAEADLVFENRQLKRRESKAITERRTRVTPIAAGGAGALLVGVLVSVLSSARRKPLDAPAPADLS